MKELIKTELAPAAIGPYSQGVKSGNVAFVSGQLPINIETGEFDGNDIVVQTKRSLENVKAVLNEKGFEMSDVIKTTVFMQNLGDFVKMNEVYGAYFTENFPARSTIEVAGLPKGALVEIEVIAVK